MPKSRSSFIDLILDRVSDAAEDLVDDLLHDLKRELPRLQAEAGVGQGQGQRAQSQSPRPRAKKRVNKGQGRAQGTPQREKGPTLYDSLEISPMASHETAEAAFKSLARRYHPDVSKHKETEERMKQINMAWGVIGDPEKRRKYDRTIGL